MIHSMTGFGKAEKANGEKIFSVEIKALNGKQFDLQLKLPSLLKPMEIEIRQWLQEALVRGTVECVVQVKQNGMSRPVSINTDLVKAYYEQITVMAEANHMDTQSVLASILRLPDVVSPVHEVITPEDYSVFKILLEEALQRINEHRQTEGMMLQKDLLSRMEAIRSQQKIVLSLEPNRGERIRQELTALLEKHVGKENTDAIRLEQELIYYMEKIDIHEEQMRLEEHIRYFEEVLHHPDASKGKKLSFILQEVGREINTTGSKAYDISIQKAVVVMKDELEKAKEQVLNVL